MNESTQKNSKNTHKNSIKFRGKNRSSNNSPRSLFNEEKNHNNSLSCPPKNHKIYGQLASRNDYLYLYGKKKAEINKNLTEINRQNKIKRELESCTFKPKINDYSHLIVKIGESNDERLQLLSKDSVVSRLFKWVNKKNEK